MDKKDSLIIDSLKENSRKSVKELAKELGMPRTTVFDRIKKLETDGFIKKYTIVPDYEKLNLGTTSMVLITYDYKSGIDQNEVAKQIAKIPGVEEVYIITGTFDIIIKVRGENLKKIGETILDRVRGIRGVAATLSCLVFRTVKE